MKKTTLLVPLLLLVLITKPTNGQLELISASFSPDVEPDTTFEWKIDNYQIGAHKVETKTNPQSFEFIDGSNIALTVKEDPSSIDLSKKDSLDDPGNMSDYFTLSYDGLSYDFNTANQLYIWIFPTQAIQVGGTNVNLISEFWIYNIYNLFVNGQLFEFNDTLPSADVSSSSDTDLITVSFNYDSTNIQARVDKATGILNSINLVSSTPDFRIEISEKGAGSALPISPFWVALPLVLMPVILRYRRRR